MKFEDRKFSKRFPPVNCALFILHEPINHGIIEYDPRKETPGFAVRAAQYRGTAAAIILPDGRFWVGVCLCSPSDQFVKATGRAKAIGRAYQNMRQCATNGCIHYGHLTIIEAIDDKTLANPIITALKEQLQVEISEAKKRVGIL